MALWGSLVTRRADWDLFSTAALSLWGWHRKAQVCTIFHISNDSSPYQMTLWSRNYHYLHITDDKTRVWTLNDFPRTQESVSMGTQAQAGVWLPRAQTEQLLGPPGGPWARHPSTQWCPRYPLPTRLFQGNQNSTPSLLSPKPVSLSAFEFLPLLQVSEGST